MTLEEKYNYDKIKLKAFILFMDDKVEQYPIFNHKNNSIFSFNEKKNPSIPYMSNSLTSKMKKKKEKKKKKKKEAFTK